MELAGLEPATSWVRFHLAILPFFVIVRNPPRYAESIAETVVTVGQSSQRPLDQNLTELGREPSGRFLSVCQKPRATAAHAAARTSA